LQIADRGIGDCRVSIDGLPIVDCDCRLPIVATVHRTTDCLLEHDSAAAAQTNHQSASDNQSSIRQSPIANRQSSNRPIRNPSIDNQSIGKSVDRQSTICSRQ
jgi:hypothetical protein